MIAAFLTKLAVKYGAIGLAVLLLIGGTVAAVWTIYGKGERAGAGGITTKVQSETLRELDAARKQKERIDADVCRTPYDDRVDALR